MDNIEIKLLTPKFTKERGKSDQIRGDPANKRKKKEAETIIIKAGQSTYAELLKEVRKNVDIEQLNVKINSVKKTSGGDLKLQIEGNKEQAQELKTVITDKMRETKVDIKRRETIISILDVEVDIEDTAILKALEKETGVPNNEILLKSMRPMRDGNKIVTVAVDKKMANQITSKNCVKIGWVNCRIKERVEVIKCFNCHLYGHRAKECKNPTRNRVCYNCGKEGHKVETCQEEKQQFCLTCGTKGHAGGSGKCPLFKKELNEARDKTRKASGNK